MKKIMFNDRYGLTEAVLSGRKTQTRRIVTKFALGAVDKFIVDYYNATFDRLTEIEALRHYYFVEKIGKPPFKVGEVVAVAQAYRDTWQHTGYMTEIEAKQCAGYPNKMFVSADLMPHHIRITNVRVKRLQDISDEDCIAEGVVKGRVGSEDTHFMDAYYPPTMMHLPCCSPRGAYAALIDRISGKGTWDSNPYVFVYEFELVD